jgi:hypothetical protein
MFSLSLLLFVTTGNNLEELLACWVGEGWVFVLLLFLSLVYHKLPKGGVKCNYHYT